MLLSAGIRQATIENNTLINITPTVLSLLGVPLPSYMDGKPVVKVLPGFDIPVSDTKISMFREQNEETAPADTENIREQLQSIGYL